MSLTIEKAGYRKEPHECPNCGSSMNLYIDNATIRRVDGGLSVGLDKVECDKCKSILKYIPKTQ